MEKSTEKSIKQPIQATQIRRAGLEDHSDLIAIGDGFNGVDYLHHSFPRYLENPNMYCYVQICSGTVVSTSITPKNIGMHLFLFKYLVALLLYCNSNV